MEGGYFLQINHTFFNLVSTQHQIGENGLYLFDYAGKNN